MQIHVSVSDSSVPLSIGLSPTQAVSGHKDTESTAGDFFEDSIHNDSLNLHKEISCLGVRSSCQTWLRPKSQNFGQMMIFVLSNSSKRCCEP